MFKKNYMKANDKNVGCVVVYPEPADGTNARLFEDPDKTKLITDAAELTRLIEAGLLCVKNFEDDNTTFYRVTGYLKTSDLLVIISNSGEVGIVTTPAASGS